MSKKTFTVQMRRLACAVLFFAFTIFLSSCSSKEIVGSLDMNQEYASIGDISITNKELWSELKWQAHTYLSDVIEKGIISEYQTKAETVLADPTHENYDDYCDIIKEYTVTSVLNLANKTTDVSNSIEELSDNQIAQNVAKYVDSIYLEYNDVLKADEIISALAELKADDESEALSFLYKYNIEDLAKYLLAEYKLQLDIKEAEEDIDEDDEDDIGYFTKSNFTLQFENNYVNQGDVEILSLRFMNSDEANDTLKAFGIKVYKNAWYFIKNTDSYEKYEAAYDDFSVVDSASQCEKIDATYGETAIILLYLEMYNYIYTYRDALPTMGQDFGSHDSKDRRSTTQAILKYVEANDDVTVEDVLESLKNSEAYEDYIHFTAEELKDENSSLKSYIYDTLSLDDDDDYLRYSTTSSLQGSYYYMTFKFSHIKNEYDEMFDEDDTTDELYDKICANETLYNEVYEYVFEDALTDSLISSTLSTLVTDNIKVKVYDKEIEIAYACANSSYSKNHSKAPSNNVLAKVEYTDLDENEHIFYLTLTKDSELEELCYSAWDYLELNNGATTAIDVLSEKIIKATDAYKEEIDEEDYADYERSLELMLASFANDGYSSSGYPASIGKYNFLMLYFHTADIEEIIYDYFHLSDVSQKLLTNYESETLLDFFLDYSSDSYNNYFSLSATQLQVYLDINEDGKADPYTEWTTELKDAAKELLDTIVNIVEASTDNHATAIANTIEEYNDSSRFDNGLCTPGTTESYNPTSPECYWAKYRRLGLYVSTSDVTASNVSTITTIDIEVKARLLDIYKNIPSYILGETFPSQYLDIIESDTINYDYTQYGGYLETEDGLNLLLVTSGEIAASAEFTQDDDILGAYTNIPSIYNEKYIGNVDNVYNEEKMLNMNQIKVYLYEYLADQGTSKTPSTILTALEDFFLPVLERYQSNETQRVIILYVCYQLQGVDSIKFSGDLAEVNQTRFEEILDINERVTDDYVDLLGDITNTSNDYKDWWIRIEEIVSKIVGEGSNK